jgi:hypothetical protein
VPGHLEPDTCSVGRSTIIAPTEDGLPRCADQIVIEIGFAFMLVRTGTFIRIFSCRGSVPCEGNLMSRLSDCVRLLI